MNKKFLKKALILSVAAVSAVTTTLGAAGCGPDNGSGGGGGGGFDPDKDPLVFSSQDFDRVFNPFYSTSVMDANAVGMTQIGMIGNDKDGKPTFGDNEAVVTKDLEIRAIGTPEKTDTTEYYFVLKNNVRFSDGSYLTIKDVLFNMYVYLDPAYTGSSTMYSTDIVGLKEYRTQATSEKEQNAFEEKFTKAATQRKTALNTVFQAIKKSYGVGFSGIDSKTLISELGVYANGNNATYKHVVEDYERTERLFKEELQSDFNNNKDTYSEIKFTDDNGKLVEGLFTTDVEAFLYAEGFITWNKKDGKLESDVLTDPAECKSWSEKDAIDIVFETKMPSALDEIITYWATATELAIEIANDEREIYFNENPPQYTNVEGIEFINRTSPVTVHGVEYAVPTYTEEGQAVGNEVLKITINEVDPKAIWNFAFGVAPMYYYSNAEQIELFDYESHFGVKYGSQSFMTDVIKDNDKIGVPVGAGPYMAASESGRTKDISSGDFLSNNVMYFRSNPYYVMGEPIIKDVRYQVVSSNQIMNSLQTGEIHFGEPNAKVENINTLKGLKNKGLGYTSIQTAGYGYVGINAAKVPSIYVRRAIMHSIDPRLAVEYYKGTADPIYRSMSLSSWAYPDSALAYYPYIGGPIPEDLDSVYEDYKIYVEEHGFEAGYTMTTEEQVDYIKYLVEDLAGYSKNSAGIYYKGNDVLKYTFTIAGQEDDHPAFNAMYRAGQFLNDKVGGFQIITRTDNNALTKLSSGSLAVWAAAWGSTIDPDMYQVYHMDSKATSVLNWGYNSIKNNTTKYEEEYRIITTLSEYIEDARKTNVEEDRAKSYKIALDLVMELAVELPMYQRDDLFAYNTNRIDVSTFTPENERSAFKGLTADIHKLSLVTNREK